MGKTFGRARRALLLCSAISGAAVAVPAFAQDNPDTLPELVVTAERRAQNLQEVPLAATVLSGEDLIQRGVVNIQDIQRVAPSIAINAYNRSTFINIRGIGIAVSAPTSTPGVAYYLNGALIPHEQTIGMSFYDLDNIQVLRGPQGTLTGQNSTGGAIYVTTPKPKMDGFSGYIDSTVTDYSGIRVVAAANVPLAGFAALRISGIRDKRDSFTLNTGSTSQPGDVNVTAWRGDLLFQPIENWTTNFRYEKYKNDTDYNAVKRRGDVVSLDPFVIQEDAISFFRQDGYRSEIETRYDLTDGLQLRGNVNYQYGVNEDIADGDRTDTASNAPVTPPTPTSARGRLGYTQTIFNSLISEVNLITTGDSDLQWVVGGFYLTETIPLTLRTYFDRVVPTTNPNPTRTKANNLSRSLFGQANWKVSPAIELVLGARYSKDSQIYERIAGPDAGTTGVAKSDVTTGRAAVNWNLDDTTMLYASISKGYKAGGVNLSATDAPFKPETNVVEELGVKTTGLDGKLRINGSVFFSQYEDLQLSSLLPATPAAPTGTPTTANVPKSKSLGGEVEVEALLGDYRINGGIAYLQAETDSDAFLQNNTGLGAAGRVFVPAGRGLPFAPELTLTAGIERDFDLFGGTVTPRIQVSHLESQWASVFQNANSFVPARTLTDIRVSYDTGGAWRAEAFVNNVGNETYIASQLFNSSSTNGGLIYGAPRMAGLRFVVRAE